MSIKAREEWFRGEAVEGIGAPGSDVNAIEKVSARISAEHLWSSATNPSLSLTSGKDGTVLKKRRVYLKNFFLSPEVARSLSNLDLASRNQLER